VGVPEARHFEIVTEPVAALKDGQVRVRNRYLSVEPAMRGWVNSAGNYSEPVAVGAVMRSITAGVVEESRSARVQAGDWVTGMLGWQDYAVVDVSAIEQVVSERDLPLSTALGVLGINGLTAHHGLLKIGEPKAGDTLVVSTAAGAVGSCVGQIAKIKGCRTVGITGGEVKRRLCLDEFGFDEALDYKAPGFEDALKRACPDGVDIYYDNTSGAISDAVTDHLNTGARIIICGTAAISQWEPTPTGPRIERRLLVSRARMQGFVIFDHAEDFPTARRELAQWVREGRIRYREDILDGIEHAPDAIAGLYRGENLGKRLIRIT
jgi:NADPH-dependent curcumin reductase CurA